MCVGGWGWRAVSIATCGVAESPGSPRLLLVLAFYRSRASSPWGRYRSKVTEYTGDSQQMTWEVAHQLILSATPLTFMAKAHQQLSLLQKSSGRNEWQGHEPAHLRSVQLTGHEWVLKLLLLICI